MPLKPGSSRSVISSNISEMERAGHKHSQSVAAALRSAYGPKRAEGGGITGPLLGTTDGRADDIDTSVPNGSHIIPSDVVSSLGEGNSVAGAAKLSKMFPNSAKPKAPSIKMASSRIPNMPRIPQQSIPRIPKMPHTLRMRHMPGSPRGLMAGGHSSKVNVKLSDGEFAIHPHDVQHVAGDGDLERGHRALDAFILHVRHADIERRKHLPGPVQS